VFDAESGLYWFNSRIYMPELGRFGQPDSIIPDISNPQSYNRYSYVLNNPLRYTDPTGHGPNDYTGASGRAMLQDEDPEATRVVQSARQSAGTMATVGRTVAEMNPIVGAVNGAIGAKTGNDAITGEKLTTGARVLAGVGAVASLIPGEGAEAKAGAGLLKNAERGRAAEAKVLGELGLVKNTEKVIGKEGKSIPDFKTANVIGEIKDTKRVTDSPQLRIQKEAAQQSGMAHELHTGVNTAVSEKAASGTTVIRRPDLGPASSQ
jgi:RHS repeat-associated protein